MGCLTKTSQGSCNVVTTLEYVRLHDRRGLVYGLWNSHTYVGNILGSLIAGAFLSKAWNYNWGLSFIVPGLIIIGMALLVLLFLTPRKCIKVLIYSAWQLSSNHFCIFD